LFRAFADILDDTPQTYTRRLRLHRIRHNLANDAEKASTIALIASQWGVTDQGRMASRYRELFGEQPSETLARAALTYSWQNWHELRRRFRCAGYHAGFENIPPRVRVIDDIGDREVATASVGHRRPR
jgi:AraC-like DNA-binding protein